MRSVRGLRLFFPLALGFATLWVPLWMLRYTGHLPLPAHFSPSQWHGHEMIFGYLTAALAGFVTVADSGWRIFGLAALWVTARLLLLFDAAFPPILLVIVDAAFLPLLVLLRRPYLWTGRKTMMLAITAAAGLLSLLNLWSHLETVGIGAAGANVTAVAAVVLLLVAVAGRLVPGHTRAATRRGPGLRLTRSEFWGIALSAALVASTAIGWMLLSGAIAAGLCAVQSYRLNRWWDREVLRDPLLWGLHLGFAWLVVGLGLYAVALMALPAAMVAVQHVILVGAVGTLTVAIMLRLTLAHARQPQRGGLQDGVIFGLLGLAALSRGLLPVVAPQLVWWGSMAGALAWTAAFALALGRHCRAVTAS